MDICDANFNDETGCLKAQPSFAWEAEWVQRAILGDQDAVSKLYKSYVDSIYSFFCRKTRNTTEAETLTSETFTRAIAALKFGQYKWQGKPFLAWLFRIADYTFKEWIRAKQPTVPLKDLEELQHSTSLNGKEDVLDLVVKREELNRFWQLVYELPPIEAQILVMNIQQDLSYAEIAKRLQRSERACKQLRYRAVKKLKQKIRVSELEEGR
jgi:RNA polymerase sigma-70 factor (ECF subfamily)